MRPQIIPLLVGIVALTWYMTTLLGWLPGVLVVVAILATGVAIVRHTHTFE